jgi:hypothetical protein
MISQKVAINRTIDLLILKLNNIRSFINYKYIIVFKYLIKKMNTN